MDQTRPAGKQEEMILRLIKVRETLGYSQEQFAEILDISASAYKKIESYNRKISLFDLKTLHQKLNVSLDYILCGDKASGEQTWTEILNCTEADKLLLFLRLFQYFTECRPEFYPVENEAFRGLTEVVRMIIVGQNPEGYEKT